MKISIDTRERLRSDGSAVYIFDGITQDGRLVHATLLNDNCVDKFAVGTYVVIKRFSEQVFHPQISTSPLMIRWQVYNVLCYYLIVIISVLISK